MEVTFSEGRRKRQKEQIWGGGMRNLVRDMLNMRHLLRRPSGGTPETVGCTRLELGKIWAGDINLGVIRV